MRAIAVLLALLPTGCSFVFDDEQPDVTLVGEAPPLGAFERLNQATATGSTIVRGGDNEYWVAFNEPNRLMRLVCLGKTRKEETRQAPRTYLRWRSIYELYPGQKAEDPIQLVIHRAGDPAARDARFELPSDGAFGDRTLLVIGGADDIFMHFLQAPTTTKFTVIRRDLSFVRQIPVPEGLDPKAPTSKGQFWFNGEGSYLVVRDGNGKVVLYSMKNGGKDVDLGVRPARFTLDESRKTLVTIGEDGLRSVPQAGGETTVLEPAPCSPNLLWFYGKYYYYMVGDEVRRVLTDGKGAPELVKKGVGQLLSIIEKPVADILYSRDPSDRYVYGAGDGWLGDWRFMERGDWVTQSRDRTRLRWLEHSAQTTGIGDLTSATIRGEPLHLARNVRQYEELDDGRVLVIANHAQTGTFNRLVAIDEETRTAQWVCPAAHRYHTIYGTDDLIVDVVTGANGYDIYRVPLPKPLHPRFDAGSDG